MAKELPYFRFTAAEWLNGDISLEATYLKGVFIDICAYYWFKDCSLTKTMLKKKYNRDVDAIGDLIKLDILKHDEESDYLTINFLNEQYDILSERRKRRQDAGSKGGKQKSSNAKAILKQSSSYKYKDKDKDKDKDNKYTPPTFEEFKNYALEKEPLINIKELELKYEAWIENDWKTGKNQKIKNWKSTLLNTIPHFKYTGNNGQHQKTNSNRNTTPEGLRAIIDELPDN